MRFVLLIVWYFNSILLACKVIRTLSFIYASLDWIDVSWPIRSDPIIKLKIYAEAIPLRYVNGLYDLSNEDKSVVQNWS